MLFRIEIDDLHRNGIVQVHNLRRMTDPAPAQIGNMKQAIKASQIDENTKIGDIFHPALKDLPRLEIGNKGPAFLHHIGFEELFPGENDIFSRLIEFHDFEFQLLADVIIKILYRADIDLRSREEGRYTTQIHDHTSLDPPGNSAQNGLTRLRLLANLGPMPHKIGFLLGEHRLPIVVFQFHQIDNDFIPNLGNLFISKLFLGNNTLGLKTNIH